MVIVEVKCKAGHRCVVLPGQITPPGIPMCEADRCYKPMFAVEARDRRPNDRVYRDGRPA